MKIINRKVYTLDEMTQDELNELALERNTLVAENETLKEQLFEEKTKNYNLDIYGFSVIVRDNKTMILDTETLKYLKNVESKYNKLIKQKCSFTHKHYKQQRVFIKWLEDSIKVEKDETISRILRFILCNYKESINLGKMNKGISYFLF